MSGYENQAWEYHIERELGQRELDALGRDGWELVGIENGTFYLKRPRLSFKEQVTLEQKQRYYALWRVQSSTSEAGA